VIGARDLTLSAGTRLGPYEILAPLGAGGMGEVYKARDTRLERTVAVKVLPTHLSASPEVRQRFEREAKTISQLSHPHICALYDVGREGETEYLVMEYLEGETLADRLAKGPLPLEQTLRFGVQIADALDKAHRQGIVHRDLKPGNVMITKSGVKLLDFGLAKAIAPASSPGSLTALPTQANLTQEGTILGTFQYMAPEQLEGREADARTDIFAFGCVLYEMATGKKAFSGATHASLIGAILHTEPAPVSVVTPTSPPALDRVVKTCLAKDPEDRWQSAGDLTRELRWIGEGSSAGEAAPSPITSRRAGRERVWMAAALVSLTALAAVLLLRRTESRRPRGQPLPARFEIAAPPGGAFVGRPAVSPDGRFLVSVVDVGGPDRLWLRPLDAAAGRELPGTEGTTLGPFWSPDSRSVGFFADGKLKRIEVSGGTTRTLCDASQPLGGTWNRDGVILFSADAGSGLYKVSASGGERSVVVKPDKGRTNFFKWPRFLPDGRRFLFFAEGRPEESGVSIGSLDSGETKRVLDSRLSAEYASGLLLFLGQGTLLAQPFDAKKSKLSGEATALAEGIGFNEISSSAYFSASENGVLAFNAGGEGESQPTWYDRRGTVLSTLGSTGSYDHPELSPDGKRLVIDRAEAAGRDLWVMDLSRGTATRLTFHPSTDWMPAWSPDGSRVTFVSDRDGPPNLYEKNANGLGGETLILGGETRKHHLVSSADGRFLAFQVTLEQLGRIGSRGAAAASKSDIWAMPLFGDRKAFPVLQTPFEETSPRFSPDGKFIAYASDESGRREVYVQTFPAGGGKWQVSTSGGSDPRWRADGRELFYRSDRRLMAVPVSAGASFEAGTPVALFDTKSGAHVFAVDPSGQRFLILAPLGKSAPPMTVMLDWTAGLPKK